MRLRKHHVRADLNDQRLFRALRVKEAIQFLGLDELCLAAAQSLHRHLLRLLPLESLRQTSAPPTTCFISWDSRT